MPSAVKKTKINLYCPRPEQAALHKALRRFNVLVAHRRFGKTLFCVNELISRSVRNQRRDPPPRYAYIAPLYKQVKDVAWDFLKRYALPIPGTVANEAELRVDFPRHGASNIDERGARIRLYGADNPDSLRGIGLDGVVLDEYAQMNPKMLTEVIRPALSDRRGFEIFIGTPKGHNAFYAEFENAVKLMAGGDPDHYAIMRRVSQTKIIDDEELAKWRSKMTPEEYEQEFECNFSAAIVGAYYGRDMVRADNEGRITGAPYDPRHKVYTAWDLGIGDSTSIWFAQLIGREIRLVDFYQAAGVGLDHYAKVLGEKPYLYETHYVPHDAEARELNDGRTRREMLESLGIKTKLLPKSRVEDGINAVRSILPRCWFDAVKCKDGIEALRQYRREWNDTMQVFNPRPRHDQYSHAADAFRYLAMGIDEVPEGKEWIPPDERFIHRLQHGSYDPYEYSKGYDPFRSGL